MVRPVLESAFVDVARLLWDCRVVVVAVVVLPHPGRQ